MLILILNKLIYYPATAFKLIAEFLNFFIYNCIKFIFLIKNIYKKLKKNNLRKNNLKKNQKKITPNLTLYYPLPTSILSVSIRFMGAILLILIFFCMSYFYLITVYYINFQILSLILIIFSYLIVSSFGYHFLNSLSHFFLNKK
jgi:hypothetical protein